MFAWGLSVRSPVLSALDEAVWIVTGVLLTCGFRIVYRRARSAAVSYPLLGLLTLTLSVGGALVWYGSYLVVLRGLFVSLERWLGGGPGVAAEIAAVAAQPWAISIRVLVTCGCLLLTWSSLYFGINAIIDLEVERERGERAVKLADRARLSALQTQLNPHFLFNALNGIATLIRANDRATAASMVDELGDFLRSILRKLDSPEIRVAEELALINQYLQIQRRRFGTRLQTRVYVEPETMGARLPTLILQPLVENALQHGILTQEEGGSIDVCICRRHDKLVVSVFDDGAGINSAAHETGLGLRNCADRLSALYGDDAHLSAGAGHHGKGYGVVIELPFRPQYEITPASDRIAVLT